MNEKKKAKAGGGGFRVTRAEAAADWDWENTEFGEGVSPNNFYFFFPWIYRCEFGVWFSLEFEVWSFGVCLFLVWGFGVLGF